MWRIRQAGRFNLRAIQEPLRLSSSSRRITSHLSVLRIQTLWVLSQIYQRMLRVARKRQVLVRGSHPLDREIPKRIHCDKVGHWRGQSLYLLLKIILSNLMGTLTGANRIITAK